MLRIIAKVSAKGLEAVLPPLINLHQNGFVKNCQAFRKIRRVLNLVHMNEGGPDTATLSPDAEKAFDSGVKLPI